jgi:bacterioferritin-associated ferredoxin
MSSDFEIDRCVCFDLRFSDLKRRVEERPAAMNEIARRYGCGSCCGLCRPYIERMLETGETVFREVLQPTDAESRADADSRADRPPRR